MVEICNHSSYLGQLFALTFLVIQCSALFSSGTHWGVVNNQPSSTFFVLCSSDVRCIKRQKVGMNPIES